MPDVYIQAPIETDPSALAQESYEDFQSRVPNWRPDPTALETITIDEGAAMGAEARDVASGVFVSIFRYYGATLENLPPEVASAATVTSTWTMIDDQGYTVSAGSVVGIPSSGDNLVLFEVADDVVVPPGDTMTPDGAVILEAQDEGAIGGGLGGPGFELTLVQVDPWIDGAVLVDFTEGGSDDEDDTVYLNRLSRTLSLKSPKVILPADAALMATTVPPVDRALVLDLFKPGPPYDPDPEATGVARTMTVVVQDAQGQPVPNRQVVLDLLNSLTIANGNIYVIDPTYTAVDATYTAVAYPGFDPDDVNTRALAALNDYLSPENWGLPPGSEARVWVQQDHAELYEVSTVLNNVDGLWRVTGLVLGKNGGAQTAADVELDGVAPLSQPGLIAGSTSAP